MKILELETLGFRGLPDTRWSFRDDAGAAHSLVVVTGPPASGLTTLVESIAVTAARLGGVGGIPDLERVLRAGAAGCRLRSTWEFDDEEALFGGLPESTMNAELTFQRGGICEIEADPGVQGVLARYEHRAQIAKVVLLPALRVTSAGYTPISDFEADQRGVRLDPGVDRFAGLPRAMGLLAFSAVSGGGGGATFARVQELFGELCPSVKLVGMSSTGQPEFLLKSAARLPLARLSLTERNAFVLAASLVLMALERSVVLVDTPELGLPPGLAARWLDVLRGATPEAQWIVASRDPELVARAPRASRIELGAQPGAASP